MQSQESSGESARNERYATLKEKQNGLQQQLFIESMYTDKRTTNKTYGCVRKISRSNWH